MWQCGKCTEKVEDNFDLCWNCGTSKEGVEDPAFKREGTGVDTSVRKGVAADRAAPSEAPPPAVTLASPGAAHLLARGLVWGLRGLALVAAIWGLLNLINAMEASRVANELVKQFQAFPGNPEPLAKFEQNLKAAAARQAAVAVFTAVILAVALVAVLLALAEGLRLCILIEGNTRMAGPSQGSEKGKRRQT
jgi:hypothetical protein